MRLTTWSADAVVTSPAEVDDAVLEESLANADLVVVAHDRLPSNWGASWDACRAAALTAALVRGLLPDGGMN